MDSTTDSKKHTTVPLENIDESLDARIKRTKAQLEDYEDILSRCHDPDHRADLTIKIDLQRERLDALRNQKIDSAEYVATASEDNKHHESD